jgi:hypothetical protein
LERMDRLAEAAEDWAKEEARAGVLTPVPLHSKTSSQQLAAANQPGNQPGNAGRTSSRSLVADNLHLSLHGRSLATLPPPPAHLSSPVSEAALPPILPAAVSARRPSTAPQPAL